MSWVQEFLKKHKRQQAFDDARKEIPPYPRFSVPKKAYREVTQWQGKEMGNLSRGISAILAAALRNPDSSQHHDFQIALKSVSALVDFSLKAQYRSHTRDKRNFLVFRTSKATRAEAKRQDRVLREPMANERGHEIRGTSAAKRRLRAPQERLQRVHERADLICRENHFNLIKMHYLSHFSSHV